MKLPCGAVCLRFCSARQTAVAEAVFSPLFREWHKLLECQVAKLKNMLGLVDWSVVPFFSAVAAQPETKKRPEPKLRSPELLKLS
jgi:hypothetical protein